MSVVAIVGAQWGDEGKGKIVDFLAEKAHLVVRYSGGNNAGHTVINSYGELRFHLVPAGMCWPHTTCVIGNGVAVDPGVLIEELDLLGSKGIDTSRLVVSDRAHLIMPYHVLLDGIDEERLGSEAIGTTRKGIGPVYTDKAARLGIRTCDLLDRETLLKRLQQVLPIKNNLLAKVYGLQPLSLEEMYDKTLQLAQRLKPYIRPTHGIIHEAIISKKTVILEGAQGTLLDLDHGTYPFVTSSSSSIGGVSTGLGVSPRHISRIVGVFKAYTTRVGGGAMPTELKDAIGETIRQRAWEYGTTTGRARRCGWFDGVAARYSSIINGFSDGVLTRLDVLDGLDPIKVCVAYRIGNSVTTDFPASVSDLAQAQPVYEEFPGWEAGSTAGTTSYRHLPPRARAYVRKLEEVTGCSMSLISTGPHRNETIVRRPIP